MTRPAPVNDIDESTLKVKEPKKAAAGIPAVKIALERGIEQAGVARTARSLLRINQRGGFDCPGCAWPESITGPRKPAEFCENGAKAVAEENTKRTVTPEFWARHSIEELATKTEYWLGQQGRITEPVIMREGETHYSPISWADAFSLIGERIRATTPDRGVFYTSGRTATRPRSSTSCSRARLAPTTCRTAPTCATSPPARARTPPSASAREPCRWRTSTTPN